MLQCIFPLQFHFMKLAVGYLYSWQICQWPIWNTVLYVTTYMWSHLNIFYVIRFRMWSHVNVFLMFRFHIWLHVNIFHMLRLYMWSHLWKHVELQNKDLLANWLTDVSKSPVITKIYITPDWRFVDIWGFAAGIVNWIVLDLITSSKVALRSALWWSNN